MGQAKRPIALATRGLTRSFDRPAVDGLDLIVYSGEFYALVGPNGAGKTTTLRMVVGLLRPDAGTIAIEGINALADEPARRRSHGNPLIGGVTLAAAGSCRTGSTWPARSALSRAAEVDATPIPMRL